MRYVVNVGDFNGTGYSRTHRIVGLTLAQAWRVVRRHARRGIKLYSGSIDHGNWGMRGGQFPERYRIATISMQMNS